MTKRVATQLGALMVLVLVAACAGSSPSKGSGSDKPGAEAGASGMDGSNDAGRTGSAGRPDDAGGAGGSKPLDPGIKVTPKESPGTTAERQALKQALAPVASISAADLASRYPTSFAPAPSYDLSKVAGLSTIQASHLKLNEAELAAVADHGFVITSRQRWPSFLYGYATIYLEDLPVYVSADSLLFAVHRSYDAILSTVESTMLVHDLDTLLSGMRERLEAGSFGFASGEVREDIDVYLAVAASLLGDSTAEPVAGGDAQLIADLVAKAKAASGEQTVTLFGVRRDEDFSQFTPRGHYIDSPVLTRYFRAMMWLGRTDFRMLETQPDGGQVFRRRQLEGALALRDLVDAELLPSFSRIDDTVTAFVGEHDYMQLHELDDLLGDLGVSDPAGLAALSDQAVAAKIAGGGYGAQRISSHIMINGMEIGTLPLSASFAFLGQRYVLDSHVFSNVVFDRAGHGSVLRMMPSPFDVAFAALGNNQALELLAPELARYAYAPDLGAMRVLADEHPPEFWQANLYNHWLGSLRTLAPNAAPSDESPGLPPVAKSALWGKRLLSAELASWAELRHDTILYAKQSYTGGNTCEFPNAYVDPYPQFYAKLGEYAAFGQALADELGKGPRGAEVVGAIRRHFTVLGDVSGRLKEMAEHELTGAPFTAEMMTFINDAVTVQPVCGGDYVDHPGWYGQLFFGDGLEFDPTIADVHTQPTDEAGNPVGRVLHVGTGPARMMLVVADGCSGPRAYVGLASSYFEKTTDNFQRLTDPKWAAGVYKEANPPWLSGVVE
jgi:uncharacterized protein DUF3160